MALGYFQCKKGKKYKGYWIDNKKRSGKGK